MALRDDTGCEGASGELVPLGNFTYDNEKLWCLLHSELQETDLLGVSVGYFVIFVVEHVPGNYSHHVYKY